MPFCSNCGTKTNEGAKFCANCGVKLDGIVVGQTSQHEPLTPDVEIQRGTKLDTIVGEQTDQYQPLTPDVVPQNTKKNFGCGIVMVLAIIGVLFYCLSVDKSCDSASPVTSNSTAAGNNNSRASSNENNRLTYTSWEPRPGPDIYASDVSKATTIDFQENTFVGQNLYGVVASGSYTVSGDTVTFISVLGMPTTGRLSGGRLIIGRAVFYQL
jgi:hypothetical protein